MSSKPITFLVELPGNASRGQQPFSYQAVVGSNQFQTLPLVGGWWLVSMPPLFSDAHPELTITLPAEQIHLRPELRVFSSVRQVLSQDWWLVIGIPFLVLIYRLISNISRARPLYASTVPKPFTELRPLEMGVLLNGRITNFTLVAAIYDLADRGHIGVVFHSTDAVLFRSNGEDALSMAEDLLLQALIPYTEQFVWVDDIANRIGVKQFSTTLSNLYGQAYERMQEKGWLSGSLQQLHVVQKIWAIAVQFTGLAAVVLAGITQENTLSKNLYVIGSAWYIIGWLLFYLANRSRNLSKTGQEALGSSLLFKEYSQLSQPLDLFQADAQNIFYTYLGYTLLFGVGQKWINRFGKYVLPPLPSWATSPEIEVGSAAHFVTLFDSKFSQLAPIFKRSKGSKCRLSSGPKR